MYENKTYEALLASALARVRGDIDKREGSMVMNGVAPSMAELAQLYIAADFVFRATYLATAPREYLILRAADRGMTPHPPSAAVHRAELNIKVPEGTRFSCEDLNFVVTGYLEHEDETGVVSHLITCETAGAVANNYSGQLVPVEYVNRLTFARIAELVTPGNDEEDTEDFRQRVLDSYRAQAFGGNQTDYKDKIRSQYGVEMKVHPVWNSGISPASLIPPGEATTWYEEVVNGLSAPVSAWLTAVYTAAINNKLTVGGTVRIVVMDADHTPPDPTLVDEIQNAVDPSEHAGEGIGFAPIGHVVSVVGVTAEIIRVSLKLSYTASGTWESAKPHIEEVIASYISELAAEWANSEHLTVRRPIITSRILLDSKCASDIENVIEVRINDLPKDLVLDADSIPVLPNDGDGISEIAEEGVSVDG